MAKTTKPRASKAGPTPVETYRHPEATSLLRPDVGTQAQFRKKKPPQTYRYDSSLSPALDWDGGNGARELGEWLIRCMEQAAQLPPPHTFPEAQTFKDGRGNLVATVRNLQDAVEQLRRLSGPFLNWAGKAERLSFDVPTLPLFIHERLSTQAILETLKGHRRDKQMSFLDLFGDPQHSVSDQVLRAYEHANGWTNRLILGDSLVVMNSLLHYEGMGGQVQMIYVDPPYGVKFGSNFQPFVRKRDVTHNDDEDMTREPEMVKAYRDTWEMGLHSYLTYMRDRLHLAHDLLHPSGSIFVQISDENLHHVRELMDEIFGAGNFVSVIAFRKTSNLTAEFLPTSCDFIIWYAKEASKTKYHQLFTEKTFETLSSDSFGCVELPDGSWRRLTQEEKKSPQSLPTDWRLFGLSDLTSSHFYDSPPFEFQGKIFTPKGRYWSTSTSGLKNLAKVNRLASVGDTLRYKRFISDFPVTTLGNTWDDTGTGTQTDDRIYVVQTTNKVIQRCILMTTDPGDLVLDPTCGSGSTAFVAEQWGRRWISADVSRVPLALARQRLLTATFSYYELKDEKRGPAGGFVYQRKQNNKGEEVGGIVPHVTLKSIANDEPATEEVLMDRPEEAGKITRVTGPFTVEATIPTPVDWEGDGEEDGGGEAAESHGSFVDRMLEVLRKSPVLHVGGGKAVTLSNGRPPAKTLSLSAEALVDVTAPGQRPTLQEAVQEAEEKRGQALPLSKKPVAIIFGPENGAVSEKLVYEAAREAYAKSYTHLYVIGFAIQSNARGLVEQCEAAVGVPATYVQATPDLMMGDLLKNMRSSQIFSVCGLPEVRVRKVHPKHEGEPVTYQAELLGLDLFDPATMEAEHRKGDDVPAWLLDTDYNNLCFHAGQVFFPRTSAWDALKRALRGTHEDSVWDHLSGTVSAPFEAGEHGQVAVKVIDDRGNELLVVKSLKEAE